MVNKNYQKFPSKGPPKKKSGPKHDSVSPEKTMNWPGLPGKTQTKDRSQGVPRVKPAAASEGI